MLERTLRYFRYQLERFLLRGPLSRLLLVMILIALIAVVGGTAAWLFSSDFTSLGDAIWWAFLRLTDPGYLGDDEGAFLRVVSTVITVIGYVIFLGALVAIMTQWFNQTMRNLSTGVTPLAAKNHIVVIGVTNRTPTILKELFLSSGRVRRFLRLRGTRQLHVAILAERQPEDVLLELKSELGDAFNRSAITVRYGSPLREEHLRRVDFLRASAILVPADDERGTGFRTRDEDATKILLAIGQAFRDEELDHPPVLVAEVSSDEKAALAKRAYGGDCEIVPTEQMVAWILAQEVRSPGVLDVFDELLAQEEGHRVYVAPAGAAIGRSVVELVTFLPAAVVIGVLHAHDPTPIMNPPGDLVVAPGDRLICVSRDLSLLDVHDPTTSPPSPVGSEVTSLEPTAPPRRVLLLGWSRKVPALIEALAGSAIHATSIDVFARLPIHERQIFLERGCPAHRLHGVRHLEGDLTSRFDLRRIDFSSYDHVILVASDRLESDAESDARTMLAYMAVDDLIEDRRKTLLTAEMLHPENAALLVQRGARVVQSAVIPSMLLTQVTLYRDLYPAFDDIVRPGGAEFRMVQARELGLLEGRRPFSEIRVRGLQYGVTVLGARRQGDFRGSDLVTQRDQVLDLRPDTDLVVLLTDDRRSTQV